MNNNKSPSQKSYVGNIFFRKKIETEEYFSNLLNRERGILSIAIAIDKIFESIKNGMTFEERPSQC